METGTNSYLRIQTFWDVMLCEMVHSYQQSSEPSRKRILKMVASYAKTSVTIHQATRRNVSDIWILIHTAVEDSNFATFILIQLINHLESEISKLLSADKNPYTEQNFILQMYNSGIQCLFYGIHIILRGEEGHWLSS